MSSALVVGNGESRRLVSLTNLTSLNGTVGCNALHRDLIVDHLVCCDRKMVEEAIVSTNTTQTNIYVRPDWYRYFQKIRKDKRICPVPTLPYTGSNKQDQPLHWGSGPYAVLLASQLQPTVKLLGFDLYSNHGLINNVYKDTQNYASANSKAVDYVFWIYQIAKIFKHFPSTAFYVYNTDDWKMPREWQYNNVSYRKISDIG